MFIPLAIVLFACGGRQGHHPPASQSGGNGTGGTSGFVGGSTGSSDGCADVAGTWLMGSSDCGDEDLVIAQDDCNLAARWSSPLAGSINGGALTIAASESSLVCTAAVNGDSLSGTCTTDDVDGSASVCTFDAIFAHR